MMGQTQGVTARLLEIFQSLPPQFRMKCISQRSKILMYANPLEFYLFSLFTSIPCSESKTISRRPICIEI